MVDIVNCYLLLVGGEHVSHGISRAALKHHGYQKKKKSTFQCHFFQFNDAQNKTQLNYTSIPNYLVSTKWMNSYLFHSILQNFKVSKNLNTCESHIIAEFKIHKISSIVSSKPEYLKNKFLRSCHNRRWRRINLHSENKPNPIGATTIPNSTIIVPQGWTVLSVFHHQKLKIIRNSETLADF